MDYIAQIRKALAGDDAILLDPGGIRWTTSILQGGPVDPALAEQVADFHYRRFQINDDERDLYLGVMLASTVGHNLSPVGFALAAEVVRAAQDPADACDIAFYWASDPANMQTLDQIDQIVIV